MRRSHLIVWAYLIEYVAAGLLLLLLVMVFGDAAVADFMKKSASDVSTVFGVSMLAASLGFLWAFYSKADTPFYIWLDRNGIFDVFLNATVYVVALSLFSAMAPLGLKVILNDNYALFVVFVELLTLINLYTLIKNVILLMKLNSVFNQLS